MASRQSAEALKLERLQQLKDRLTQDYQRERIPVSEASKAYVTRSRVAPLVACHDSRRRPDYKQAHRVHAKEPGPAHSQRDGGDGREPLYQEREPQMHAALKNMDSRKYFFPCWLLVDFALRCSTLPPVYRYLSGCPDAFPSPFC